jgi:hypothetical protein
MCLNGTGSLFGNCVRNWGGTGPPVIEFIQGLFVEEVRGIDVPIEKSSNDVGGTPMFVAPRRKQEGSYLCRLLCM